MIFFPIIVIHKDLDIFKGVRVCKRVRECREINPADNLASPWPLHFGQISAKKIIAISCPKDMLSVTFLTSKCLAHKFLPKKKFKNFKTSKRHLFQFYPIRFLK